MQDRRALAGIWHIKNQLTVRDDDSVGAGLPVLSLGDEQD